ncbi:unnamed protein product, partial [Mesorhabditis spiculigera]
MAAPPQVNCTDFAKVAADERSPLMLVGNNLLLIPLLIILLMLYMGPLKRLTALVDQLEKNFCVLWDATLQTKPPPPIVRAINEAALESSAAQVATSGSVMKKVQ